MLLDPDIRRADVQICTRCIYDERVPSISFDEDGVCNYCRQVDFLRDKYGTGEHRGEAQFAEILDNIRAIESRAKYNCIVGVSGGTDSSYLVYLAREWGLRPLAVHYDNTWNSAVATMNIQRVLSQLDVDLYTHVVDNVEADDIFRSFFLAGVAEIEAPTDLGYAYLLRLVAAKYSIRYILEGHSFVEEGITPLGRNYFDGRYIRAIHGRFGRVPMRTYPLMTLAKFLRSSVLHQIQFIRPFWYLDYSKAKAQQLLKKQFDWKYYGGHHLENRMTAFYHGVYMPTKFKSDLRNNTLAARARNGAMSRSAAWAEYNTEPIVEDDLVVYFRKRLRLTEHDYADIMAAPPKHWSSYPTYKRTFERLRPLFAVLAKRNRVPMSFYLKYCFPSDATA